MTTTEQSSVLPHFPAIPLATWQAEAHDRLELAFQLSPRFSFDDETPLILMSDSHRGTKGRDDLFAPNEDLFLHALHQYFERGYTFIEVGDGDELWHNRAFADVRRTYPAIFDLFARFRRQNRLRFIIGNHDSPAGMFDPLEKEGLPVHQGLVMQHTVTGQTFFAVHGHQVGRGGDRLWRYQRLHSRYVWKHMLGWFFTGWHYFSEPEMGLPARQHLARLPRWFSDWVLTKAELVETLIQSWARRRRQTIICGHTHLCAFPAPGKKGEYFNTGHCSTPGYITGLEIHQGQIRLIKWTAVNDTFQRHLIRQIPLTAVAPD